MASTTLSIRLEQSEKDSIIAYANLHSMSVADVIRESVSEKIEDELDLKLYELAKAAYDKNPVSYSHDEVGKMLDFA